MCSGEVTTVYLQGANITYINWSANMRWKYRPSSYRDILEELSQHAEQQQQLPTAEIYDDAYFSRSN